MLSVFAKFAKTTIFAFSIDVSYYSNSQLAIVIKNCYDKVSFVDFWTWLLRRTHWLASLYSWRMSIMFFLLLEHLYVARFPNNRHHQQIFFRLRQICWMMWREILKAISLVFVRKLWLFWTLTLCDYLLIRLLLCNTYIQKCL